MVVFLIQFQGLVNAYPSLLGWNQTVRIRVPRSNSRNVHPRESFQPLCWVNCRHKLSPEKKPHSRFQLMLTSSLWLLCCTSQWQVFVCVGMSVRACVCTQHSRQAQALLNDGAIKGTSARRWKTAVQFHTSSHALCTYTLFSLHSPLSCHHLHLCPSLMLLFPRWTYTIAF